MSGDGQNTANSSETVLLIIRCAFQTAADQTIDAGVNWTVKKLKEHIQEVHPSHPDVNTQRLIYGGGCLTDERLLCDVFQQSPLLVDGPPVVHLVSPLQQGHSVLRQRNNRTTTVTNGAIPSMNQPPSYQSVYMQAPLNPGSSSQEAYHQYYQNYMNYLQAYQTSMVAAMSGSQYAFPHPVFVQNAPGMPMMPYFANMGNVQPRNLTGAGNPPIVLNPVNVANPAGENQQQPQAHVDRGIGGLVEDGLEFFYKGVRVLFLLMAVLLYSSLERFLLVVGIVLVIMFTQFRRAQNRHAEADLQPVNNNNAGEQHDEVDEHQNQEVEHDDETAAPQIPVAQESTLQVFLATCYSFVTSFIASLVPDNIPVDVN